MRKEYIFGIIGLVVLSLLVAGIVLVDSKQQSTTEPVVEDGGDTDTSIVGGDRDEYGCIGSAGYSWCEPKQKCLRVWEEACEDEGNTDTVATDTDATVIDEEQEGSAMISEPGKIGYRVKQVVVSGMLMGRFARSIRFQKRSVQSKGECSTHVRPHVVTTQKLRCVPCSACLRVRFSSVWGRRICHIC
jgi:hypothetical protein